MVIETANDQFRIFGGTSVMLYDFKKSMPFHSSFPAEVQDYYRAEIGIKTDPALRLAIKSGLPVTGNRFLHDNPKELRFAQLMSLAAKNGIQDCFGYFLTPKRGSLKYIIIGFNRKLDSASESDLIRIQRLAEILLRRLADMRSCEERSSALSDREKEILYQAVIGKSDKIIARELGLAPSTVRTLLKRGFDKLGVNSRVGAAVSMVHNGLILT